MAGVQLLHCSAVCFEWRLLEWAIAAEQGLKPRPSQVVGDTAVLVVSGAASLLNYQLPITK